MLHLLMYLLNISIKISTYLFQKNIYEGTYLHRIKTHLNYETLNKSHTIHLIQVYLAVSLENSVLEGLYIPYQLIRLLSVSLIFNSRNSLYLAFLTNLTY